MKHNFWKQFVAGAVLAIAFSGAVATTHADEITIEFETDLGQTPIDLDNGPSLDMISVANPISANVAEDTTGTLVISVIGATSFDPANSNVNASGGGFGINSPSVPDGSENSSRFDVSAEEALTFAFNQDVRLLNIDLTSFSGEEEFTAAGVNFTNDQATNTAGLPVADGSDLFVFADGGVFLPAGTGFSLEASGPAGSSVGLTRLTIDRIAVPEPSSIALLGLLGLGAFARRRR